MVYLYFCRITECRIDRFSRQTFWLDAGVTNNVNDVPVLLKCPNKPWQWASAHGARPLKLRERNEIQPSLILLYAPVLLRPWRIKMSSQQKAQCPWSNSGLFLSSVWLAGEKKGETDRGIVCFTNLLWELVLAGRGACSYKPFVVWRRIWHWPPPQNSTSTHLPRHSQSGAKLSASFLRALNEQNCEAGPNLKCGKREER